MARRRLFGRGLPVRSREDLQYMRRAGRVVAEMHDRIREAIINGDRKSTRLNSSHVSESRMPSSA